MFIERTNEGEPKTRNWLFVAASSEVVKSGLRSEAQKRLWKKAFVGIRKCIIRNYHNKFLCLLCKDPCPGEKKNKCRCSHTSCGWIRIWFSGNLWVITDARSAIEKTIRKVVRMLWFFLVCCVNWFAFGAKKEAESSVGGLAAPPSSLWIIRIISFIR